MTPKAAKASHARMLGQVGEPITLRRYVGIGGDRPYFDCTVTARVVEYAAHDLVGGIQQGDRKLIVLAQDLFDAQWPAPPKRGDSAIVRGKEMHVEAVDDNTRRIKGELIAYEVRVRG
jgi:hypothetical protein